MFGILLKVLTFIFVGCLAMIMVLLIKTPPRGKRYKIKDEE